jgi:hypothetical protein
MKKMKKILLVMAGCLLILNINAQDSAKVKVLDKNIVTVVEDNDGTKVKIGSKDGIEVIANEEGDTVRIRIGKRTFKIIDGEDGTEVKSSREPKDESRKRSRYLGHWGGIELGTNIFYKTDYSLYPEELGYGEFLDINHTKSLSFNINFAEFAFKNDRKTVALVTGMGFSMVNLRLDQFVSVTKDPVSSQLIPVFLDGEVKKSKLYLSYLTIPMILEIVTPLKMHSSPLTLGAGVIGGLNIGSHTKVKYQNAKEKERRNFNINPLKYELTGRIGMGDIALFANYGMSSLFKTNKGPEVFPLTVGVSLSMN